MDFFVGVVKAQPLLSIAFFSLIITIFMTFAYKRFTDQEKMKSIKEKNKELQKKSKEYRNDPNKMMELQKEMMEISMDQMKESFKPMMVTFIPLILVFIFLRAVFSASGVGDILVSWGRDIPMFHTGLGWLEWYIIFSLVFNSALRKMLKIH